MVGQQYHHVAQISIDCRNARLHLSSTDVFLRNRYSDLMPIEPETRSTRQNRGVCYVAELQIPEDYAGVEE